MTKAKTSKQPKAARLPKNMRGRCVTVWWEDARPQAMMILGEEKLPKSYKWRSFYAIRISDKNPKHQPGSLEYDVNIESSQIIHVGPPMLPMIRNLYQSFKDYPDE